VIFYLKNRRNLVFESRVSSYINDLAIHLPYLKEYNLFIESINSFPHSAGIASSASAMGALSLCLCEMEEILSGKTILDNSFYTRASNIARLGSGSACRSVYPGFVVWGSNPVQQDSKNEYSMPVSFPIHDSFLSIRDAILIVDSKKKSVSSSEGHKLMEKHAFREQRIQQAQNNLFKIQTALKTGDWFSFFEIIENEALTLHGLMFNSEPSFILIKPETLEIINRIRYLRKKKLPIGFTLDAGPNIHLLYPKSIYKEVKKIITKKFSAFCEQKRWIDDCIGTGPKKLL